MNRVGNVRGILVWSVATLLLTVATTATAQTDDLVSGDWTYYISSDGKECYISGYKGNTDVTTLTIPRAFGLAYVKGINGIDFSQFTNLETLDFERGSQVREMPSMTNCSKLKTISYDGIADQLPDAMTKIPNNCFKGTAITELIMPGVTEVGMDTFRGCSLTKVVFKKAATIGSSAFREIPRECLVEYAGPMENWSVGNYMYSPNLIVVGTTDEGENWFCGWCGGADYASGNYLYYTMDTDGHMIVKPYWDTYDQRKQVIATHRWHDNKARCYMQIITLTLENVYAVSYQSFRLCTNLTSISFGNDVTSIGEEAFLSCTGLTTITIPNGVVTIGDDAFMNCEGLTSVTIPNSVIYIGKEAFKNCSSLSDLYFDGMKAEWNVVTKGSSWNAFVSSSFKEHWRCTVTFDANGHGTDPAAVTDAWSHALLTEPAAPTAAGYQFVGWYRDAACTTAWDFSNDLVPGDGMTLYAKWESIVTDSGSSNSTSLTTVNGTKLDLQLTGRTLYLDGKWNTLCLPFAMTADQIASSLLDGFTVKELDVEAGSYAHATGLDGTTLYLNFKDATSIEAGKPYIVKNATPASTLKVIATDGTKGYNNNEGYASLVDGNTGTKWCSNTTHSGGQPWVCQFQTASPVAVTGYTLTTGGDTGNNSDRNPVIWTFEAKANDADGWTVIDSRDVTANEGDALPAANTESKAYAIATEKQGTYQYFRFTVNQSGGDLMQLAELQLHATFDGTIIKNPLFMGVTVNATAPTEVKSTDGTVTFTGNYDRVDIAGEDKSILYLGGDNTLYYPSAAMSLNAFRAYFQLDDASAATLKRTVINFGEGFGDDATGVIAMDDGQCTMDDVAGAWYDLSGRRLPGKPTKKGIYIVNGRKVAVLQTMDNGQ